MGGFVLNAWSRYSLQAQKITEIFAQSNPQAPI